MKRIKLTIELTKKQHDKLLKIQRSMKAPTRQEAIRHLIEVDRYAS